MAFVLLFSCCAPLFANPLEITFWHAMAGELGKEVNQLCEQFNHSQSDYRIKPIYKGSYLETITAFSAAFRAHVPPGLVQVFEVGSSTMSEAKGVTVPASTFMKPNQVETLWPALQAYYSQRRDLIALPFNVSVPVMYYNADSLKKLGYTNKYFPKTWQSFDLLLKQLQTTGQSCGYTTAYPSWIHVESFRALNGGDEHLKAHLQRLRTWHQTHQFEYAGRTDEGTVLFTSGRCTLFSQSSGAYQSLKSVAKFKIGIAAMPIDEHSTRHPNVVGGAAIWVVAGQSQAKQRGISAFFQFLMNPEVQAEWYAKTGYLPILKSTKSVDPLMALVQQEWGESTTYPSIHNAQHRIRIMNDEALEAMFADLLTPEAVLVQMSRGATYAYSRFVKNHLV